MSKIFLAPTGRISKGNVLDVSKAPLERALKDYDPQLYIIWNPKKNKKWGCWEIRRRSNTKSVAEVVEFEGKSYVRIEWCEIDIENHVLDVNVLNYNVLTKIKSMDMWNHNREFFGQMIENNEKAYDAKMKSKAYDEMRYQLRQHRTQMQAYKEMVLSGMNPGAIADFWK